MLRIQAGWKNWVAPGLVLLLVSVLFVVGCVKQDPEPETVAENKARSETTDAAVVTGHPGEKKQSNESVPGDAGAVRSVLKVENGGKTADASTGSFTGQDAAATGGAGQDAAAPGEADQPAPAGMPSQNAPQVPRDAVLVITGTGLQQDVFLAAADLRFNNPTLVERYYTSSNNWDFHKIWKVKGFDLFNLMGAENLKTDRDYPVTFQAADGLKYTETVSSLKSRCYHPEFAAAGGKPVGPLIGVYRQAVFEPNYQGLPGEVSWADRQLTAGDRDDRAPRLYLGQKQGNPSDRNQSLFVRDLVRIVVGEERPAGGDAL
jgi:hypothetical protein